MSSNQHEPLLGQRSLNRKLNGQDRTRTTLRQAPRKEWRQEIEEVVKSAHRQACTDTNRVRNLTIKNLDFSAPFPNAICGLTELESLEIYNWTGLHGPIPSCIHKLVNLRSLVITGTSLSGTLPKFSKNVNLIGITLSNNHLSGTIPKSLSTLPNLQLLDLSSNYLCGKIPKGGNMGQFKPAGFANNTCLCGKPLPPCFNSAPTSAPAHSPASTALLDSAPEPSPVSTTLFDLAPAHAPVSTSLFDAAPAPAPTPISPTDLEWVPPPISQDDVLLLLEMKKELGFPKILDQWWGGFEFCGSEIYDGHGSKVAIYCTYTSRVSYIVLINLPVSAPFPNAICGFTELEGLEIYNSPGLHGSIPSCLSEFVNLKYLIIKDTSLSGSIPNLSKNTNLETIILNNNHLSGTIPLSFSTFPLWYLDLSSNYLCGEIPNLANSMAKFDATKFSNNKCLCGNPLPPCNNLAPTSAPAPAPQVSAPVP
ncbi:Polygalacturonase inhibitor 1 [Carex littledalei]|uniref:Polygalacturonase inhibitor 1 n=1 Tax=Carex littledalei TaxID=544730 RepID=A0A833V4T2_9POAL|nr:Polygalacturonase inhibitor 1 [Carex littledalei]